MIQTYKSTNTIHRFVTEFRLAKVFETSSLFCIEGDSQRNLQLHTFESGAFTVMRKSRFPSLSCTSVAEGLTIISHSDINI